MKNHHGNFTGMVENKERGPEPRALLGYPGSFQKMGLEVFENYECDGQMEMSELQECVAIEKRKRGKYNEELESGSDFNISSTGGSLNGYVRNTGKPE